MGPLSRAPLSSLRTCSRSQLDSRKRSAVQVFILRSAARHALKVGVEKHRVCVASVSLSHGA